MSMDSAGIFCTGCEYKSREVYRPLCIRYMREDGKTVEVGRAKGWCYSCDDYVDIEQVDQAQLRDKINAFTHQIVELNRQLAQLQSGLFAQFFNNYKRKQIAWQLEQLLESQAETHLLLEFFQGRSAKARCLQCFSEQTAPISFNPGNHLSEGFTHHCGGQLRIAHNDIGLRLNIRRIVFVLNTEGEFIQQV